MILFAADGLQQGVEAGEQRVRDVGAGLVVEPKSDDFVHRPIVKKGDHADAAHCQETKQTPEGLGESESQGEAGQYSDNLTEHGEEAVLRFLDPVVPPQLLVLLAHHYESRDYREKDHDERDDAQCAAVDEQVGVQGQCR